MPFTPSIHTPKYQASSTPPQLLYAPPPRLDPHIHQTLSLHLHHQMSWGPWHPFTNCHTVRSPPPCLALAQGKRSPTPLGNRTTTVQKTFLGTEIALQNEEIHPLPFGNVPCKIQLVPKSASPCSEYLTTSTKTDFPVERINITFTPGVNMVVLSSCILAKVSKMSCQECKGYKW